MYNILRTDSTNNDFITLVAELNKDLANRNGDEDSFFAQFNKIDMIKHVVLVYDRDLAIGCGAIKQYEDGVMEIKRMFVLPEKRGTGAALLVLSELENWAKELGYEKCILETGEKQPEAIGLYKKAEYSLIPNYGQYVGVDSSVCFEKVLK